MREFYELESCPDSEAVASVGPLQQAQAQAWANQLVRTFGPPPAGSKIALRASMKFNEIFYEVRYYFDLDDTMSVEYGDHMLNNLPSHWDEVALKELDTVKEQQASQYVEELERSESILNEDILAIVEEALPVGSDLGSVLNMQSLTDRNQDEEEQRAAENKLNAQEEQQKAEEEKKQKQLLDPLQRKVKTNIKDLQSKADELGKTAEIGKTVDFGLNNLGRDINNIFNTFKV